ncbi:MAG: dihydroneopterin aldolase family protein [Thermoplasmata archaeon]
MPVERLCFEAGIKLGGIFHQYLGIPVAPRTAPGLARAIEAAVGLQPFVEKVRVRIDVRRGGPVGRGRFAYRYLKPEMLRVDLTISDGSNRVDARLEYRPDLRYPLMTLARIRGGRRAPH